MERKWSVWDAHINKNTYNWGGSEWVVDGERGRYFYPGYYDREQAIRCYQNGWKYDKEKNKEEDEGED